jgi:hypothetical protein
MQRKLQNKQQQSEEYCSQRREIQRSGDDNLSINLSYQKVQPIVHAEIDKDHNEIMKTKRNKELE